MIKSSKLSITEANTNRQNDLSLFLHEYKRVCQQFVDILWELPDCKPLVEKNITSQVSSWLSKRAIQACAKQASGIVRGTRRKQEKRTFKYNEFLEKGMYKRARKLKKKIDETNMSRPEIKNIEPELDSRFVKFDFDNKTSFDCWIKLTCLGNKISVILPVKKTKHFNLLNNTGKMKTGLRLSGKKVTLMFDMPDIPGKTEGNVIGIDIGIKTLLSSSDNQTSKDDIHGWNLEKILKKLSRRTKDSKGFKRAQEHRKNYVNWSINQLNLTNVKKVKIENIRHVRRCRKSSRYLSHWTYTIIRDKLEDYCYHSGVLVETVNPTYTSQRCSRCGWTRKSNRKGKQFKCTSCSFSCDADLNASFNIGLDLLPIRKEERLQRINRTGFYWFVVGQEPIVPDVRRG